MPVVSVVMAAKNYARFLPTAVQSVLAQTIADWELVIVDDGSTDETPAAARPFLVDRRLRYIRSDRLGQSRAKNLGIGLSRGEFVAFLDADDAWLPAKLEKQLASFHTEPDVGVVYCLRSIIDEAGVPLSPGGERRGVSPPVIRPAGSRRAAREIGRFYIQNPICFSSCVVRRTVFEQIGGFDPSLDLAIDYELWLRAARVTEFHCVPEELVLYRTGHGNLSKKLSDRVATAFSIMHRAERRGGIPAPAVAEGRATTARTLAYVVRDAEPGQSIRWNLQALAHGHRRRDSLRGLIATAVKWMGRKRVAASPENITANR